MPMTRIAAIPPASTPPHRSPARLCSAAKPRSSQLQPAPHRASVMRRPDATTDTTTYPAGPANRLFSKLAPTSSGTITTMGHQERVPGIPAEPSATRERDRFIDLVRAFSLLIVVAWHWVFTIIIWEADGPRATNPIGFTRGLFVATWLFQVMPLFFFVGGYAHDAAWRTAAERGRFNTPLRFAWNRAGQLARPAMALAFGWWLIGSVGVALWDIHGTERSVKLILSPLWFIAVYLLLILLFPLTHRLHR